MLPPVISGFLVSTVTSIVREMSKKRSGGSREAALTEDIDLVEMVTQCAVERVVDYITPKTPERSAESATSVTTNSIDRLIDLIAPIASDRPVNCESMNNMDRLIDLVTSSNGERLIELLPPNAVDRLLEMLTPNTERISNLDTRHTMERQVDLAPDVVEFPLDGFEMVVTCDGNILLDNSLY